MHGLERFHAAWMLVMHSERMDVDVHVHGWVISLPCMHKAATQLQAVLNGY